MAQDGPALELSDLLHSTSPSPVSQQGSTLPSPLRSSTPEPLDHEEVQSMRKKVAEWASAPEIDLGNGREKELAEMVLRLTSASNHDPTQVIRQAETISELIQQRNFIAQQAEEERSRWSAEREGWERMAEALIAQRHKGENATYKEIELEHHINHLDSDNKSLRDMLAEAQTRLHAVQTELTQLRPVLLMQPSALSNSLELLGADAPKQLVRRKKKSAPMRILHDDSDEEVDELADDQTPKAKGKDHYRRPPEGPSRRAGGSKKGRGKDARATATPLLADARAEHLLLAARRLGRQRAGVLAGLVLKERGDKEHEREREAERRRAAAHAHELPKTPRRAGPGASGSGAQATNPYPPSAGAVPAAYLYMSNGAGPMLVPVPVPTHPYYSPGHPQTPHAGAQQRHPAGHSPLHQQQQGRSPHAGGTAPSTPLDSLLTAARSMMDEDGAPSPTKGTGGAHRARHMSSLEPPESPIPAKRRKVAPPLSTPSTSARGGSGSGGEGASDVPVGSSRMRSALDVLADQAAMSSERKGKGRAPGPASGPDESPSRRTRTGSVEPGSPRSLSEDPALAQPLPSLAAALSTAAASDIRRPSSIPLGFEDPLDDPTPDGAGSPTGGASTSTSTSTHAVPDGPMRRPRSTYVKWTKDEDDLLAQAVAKFGAKWDLVSKALPARTYHQVRQRWLRKLGAFETKPDLSPFQTAATFFPNALTSPAGTSTAGDPHGLGLVPNATAPNPILGMAPLSMEVAGLPAAPSTGGTSGTATPAQHLR